MIASEGWCWRDIKHQQQQQHQQPPRLVAGQA